MSKVYDKYNPYHTDFDAQSPKDDRSDVLDALIYQMRTGETVHTPVKIPFITWDSSEDLADTQLEFDFNPDPKDKDKWKEEGRCLTCGELRPMTFMGLGDCPNGHQN